METLSPSHNPEVARLRRQSAQRKRRKRLRQLRLLWMIVGFLVLLAIIEAGMAVLISPRFWVHTIAVRHQETLTEREVIRQMNLPAHSNYFRVRLTTLEQRLRQLPRVEQASVTRNRIGMLNVDIRERRPLCRLGYYTPTFYVDRHGVVFTRPKPPATRVPVVEGVKVASPKQLVGKKLTAASMRSALACIAAMAKAGNGKGLAISRIVIERNGWMNLVLQQGTLIYLGPPDDLPLKAWCIKEAIIQASEKGYSLKQLESINVRFVNKETGVGASFLPRTAQSAQEEAIKP